MKSFNLRAQEVLKRRAKGGAGERRITNRKKQEQMLRGQREHVLLIELEQQTKILGGIYLRF